MHQAVASSPSYCEGIYSFVGVVRRRGSATLNHGCYTGVPFAVESPRTLPYGHSGSIDGVTCTASRSGLRCRNASHHGFFLSRHDIYRF